MKYKVGDRVEFHVGHAIIEGRIINIILGIYTIQSDALIDYRIIENKIIG